VPLGEEAGIVAPPVAARPPRALEQELGVVLERRLDLTLAVVLDPRLPPVRDQPPGDEVVVIRVQLELAPALRLEAVQEQGALEDLGSEGAGPARHARGAAINAVGGRDLEVPPLDVGRAQPVVDAGRHGSRPDALDPLTGTNPPDPRILERGQEPGQDRARPRDIVVGHDGDGGLDPGDGLAHLDALIRDGGVEDADVGRLERLDKREELLILVRGGDEEELIGVTGEDALQSLPQLLEMIVDGGDDDRHILG
jgi:hypothetical protein